MWTNNAAFLFVTFRPIVLSSDGKREIVVEYKGSFVETA